MPDVAEPQVETPDEAAARRALTREQSAARQQPAAPSAPAAVNAPPQIAGSAVKKQAARVSLRYVLIALLILLAVLALATLVLYIYYAIENYCLEHAPDVLCRLLPGLFHRAIESKL